MFAMGLTLTPEDFRRVRRQPGPTALGLVLQLVAMPVLGIALAYAFELPAMLAAGLVIVAACPGGIVSNLVAHMGGADTALSITLTATATGVTLLTLPLWVQGMLSILGTTSEIDIPVFATTLELAAYTVVPVTLGMMAVQRRPGLRGWDRLLSRAALGLLVAGFVVDGAQQPDPPLAEFTQSLAPGLLLLFGGVAIGLGIPMALGVPYRQATTIAAELAIKNGFLGLVWATQALGNLQAGIPIAVFITFQLPVGVGVVLLYRFVERKRTAQSLPEVPTGA